ncbi:hypothetical protein MC885_012703 [Smutsia gigantea]|nr:hypothetical protein MC885_012703 [Smutsia gigantea]
MGSAITSGRMVSGDPRVPGNYAEETHVGTGLDVQRPPLPDIQHLLVLASGVGAWGGSCAPRRAGRWERLSMSPPHQVGQVPQYAAPSRVPAGQVQPVQNSLSVVQGPEDSEQKKDGVCGQHASLPVCRGDPRCLRGHRREDGENED